MYLRSVLRSTSRLPAISLSERPACQCIKISVTSITSNVLLAIGLPSSTGGKAALSRWPGPPRHARHPHGELRERGGELRERQPLKPGNYVSADTPRIGVETAFPAAGPVRSVNRRCRRACPPGRGPGTLPHDKE